LRENAGHENAGQENERHEKCRTGATQYNTQAVHAEIKM